MTQSSTSAEPSGGSEDTPVPTDWDPYARSWPSLDRLGLLQTLGGVAIGLIALFSSYDHISFGTRSVHLQQQWGIAWIAASVALVVIDAQLETRARDRAALETARERDRADRERNLAGEERQRTDRERNRAAQSRELQAEILECLHQAAVLSACVQLDPSATNRTRLRTFLALSGAMVPPEDGEL